MMPLLSRAAHAEVFKAPSTCAIGRSDRGGRWGEATVHGIISAPQYHQPLLNRRNDMIEDVFAATEDTNGQTI